MTAGDTTATLKIRVSIGGTTMTAGTLAAFNSKGRVLGVATAVARDEQFYLSVTTPLAFDDAAGHEVTFKFDTGSAVVQLAPTYAYRANEIRTIALHGA